MGEGKEGCWADTLQDAVSFRYAKGRSRKPLAEVIL